VSGGYAPAMLDLVVLALAGSSCLPLPQGEQPVVSTQAGIWATDRDERMQRWREARFGMFVHWGLYSAAGGRWGGKTYPQHYAEWIQHWAKVPCEEYARKMKPLFVPDEGFAEQWAELAAAAGMRYAVMTSKHHDGFTLFNSAHPYSWDNEIAGGTNISPPGRDVAREFADAMRARGLVPGFYYSLLDWQHPDAYEMALPAYPRQDRPRDHARYVDYIASHVHELLTGYGELGTIWFDYSDATRQGEAWGAERLLRMMREEQPGILVNNRLYLGLENKNGDYGTPEKYVPPTGLPGMDWEVNHTLNESYGYSAHDENWKDTTTVVRLLCDIVSKGGNLLLNIGPDARGRVPEPAQQALRGVGRWMETFGEAIYGTTASPFQKLTWGRATRRGNTLYLMVFDWPVDGRLAVPLENQARSLRILGSDAVVEQAATLVPGMLLIVPSQPVNPACTVIEVVLDGDPVVMPFRVHAAADGAFSLTPHDATLHGEGLRVERVGAVGDVRYNIGYWLDAAQYVSWPLQNVAARDYKVVAEIACKDTAAGAELEFLCGDKRLPFTAPATGGWQEYREVELGRLRVPAGDVTVELRACSKPGEAVLNLRLLRLVP
jgi:alpha-L-fucosidase